MFLFVDNFKITHSEAQFVKNGGMSHSRKVRYLATHSAPLSPSGYITHRYLLYDTLHQQQKK